MYFKAYAYKKNKYKRVWSHMSKDVFFLAKLGDVIHLDSGSLSTGTLCLKKENKSVIKIGYQKTTFPYTGIR